MSTPQRYTDAEMLAAIDGAQSLTDAMDALGLERNNMRKRCYRSVVLMRAYLACRARGHTDSATIPGATPKTCGICQKPNHNRQNCPTRERADRYCAECCGLPWRRPRGIRVLCACGEAWEPEPRVTLDDMFEQPRENRRTY